jgi:hypothetical protein
MRPEHGSPVTLPATERQSNGKAMWNIDPDDQQQGEVLH